MRKWLWIAVILILLAICLGVAVAISQQKPVFGGYVNGMVAKCASSVSASQKSERASRIDSLAKYTRQTENRASQPNGGTSSSGVNQPNHAASNVDFRAAYSLTYDANMGEGLFWAGTGTGHETTCSAQHASGETVSLTTGDAGDCWTSKPAWDGYRFMGWSTTKLTPFSTFRDAKAHVTDTMTMSADGQTVYAVWTKVYTVTFKTQMNADGIAASTPPTLLTEQLDIDELPTTPTPPETYNKGLNFMGWGVSKDSTDTSGEGVMVPFDATVPVTGSETVWPMWGYEDTLDGHDHKCIMGVDTVATCFPDEELAQTLIKSAQATAGIKVSDVWTQRDALFFGNLNFNLGTGNETENVQLKISELDGLQTLTGLGELHISDAPGYILDAHSNDLHQLQYLPKLSNLFAIGDGITDVSKLSGLSNLAILYLSNNNISDVSGLSGLSNLANLELTNNKVSDLRGLSGLSSLQSLYLSHNKVSSLDGLSGLSKLQILDLSDNQISDLSGLASPRTAPLTNLKGLYLDDNEIDDVSPLSQLQALDTLRLKHNKIPSIDKLASLHAMYSLSLDDNTIGDISVINHTNFPYLNMLGLSSNDVSDISSLRGMTSLSKLWLHHNNVSDISPLEGLTGLTILYIGSNCIRDISPLKNLVNLSGGTNYSCDVGNSNFCADNQKVTLPQLTADPGLSMPTAVTLQKSSTDGSVSGAAVEPMSDSSVLPSAGHFDAEHQQLTWAGPMPFNSDDSPEPLTQEFSAAVQLPNTTGIFSGTITGSYKVAQHVVTFDLGEDALLPGQSSSAQVYSGYKLETPTVVPTRVGYRFTGWYDQVNPSGTGVGDTFDFTNTPVTKDVTLHAGWIPVTSNLPFTGASDRAYWWRGGLAVVALVSALASGLLKRYAVER